MSAALQSLYRAVYQTPPGDGGKVKGITFAAGSDEQATRFAADWTFNKRRLLTVKRLRPLRIEAANDGSNNDLFSTTKGN